MQSIVRYGYVPFMMLGLNGAAFAVVAGGQSYLYLGLVLLVAIGTAFAAERVLPWHPSWNESMGDRGADTVHGLVYEISNINSTLLLPLIVWLTPWAGIWPREWPLVVQLLAALIWVDFGLMFMHYLSHRIPLLWRLHAVHHGVGRMYGFNGLVRHPLHQALDLAVVTGPLALLGMPMEVAVLLGVAITIQLLIQHSNVAYALGPFENQLSIGKLHHLHHVNWGKEGDCNFGLFLTVWDRLLGTLNTEPSRPVAAGDLGVDELPDFPRQSYWQQLLLPLRYVPGSGVDPRAGRQHERSSIGGGTSPARAGPAGSS